MPWELLLGSEVSAERGSDSDRREEVGRHAAANQHARTVTIVPAEEPRDVVVRRQGLKGVIMALPIEEIRIGRTEIVRRRNVRRWNSRRKFQSFHRNQSIRV